MSFPLVIKDAARRDIFEAFRSYAEISERLAEDFVSRLDEAFERIAAAPESYARVFNEIRQMRVQRFPYVVSYLVEEECVVVLAVLHGHRNPSAWRSRN